MNILVVVGNESEVQPMKRLLKAAGVQAQVYGAFEKLEGKPTMKEIRAVKPQLDVYNNVNEYDYIVAAGETAARLVLDKATVNIARLRGRDFEYVTGTKASKRHNSV